ncbi:MAG: InlB B-repeat-containing protein [Treponema sp.]|nr:InlB B-repeat-containing protein [Treponema sp.]
MKRKLLICITALFALLITSCGNGLSVKNDIPQNMGKIVINAGVDTSARHYFPTGDEVDVSKFQGFYLEAKNTSTNETTQLVLNGSFSDFSEPLVIAEGIYNFTLTAFKHFGENEDDLIQFTDTLENIKIYAKQTNKLSFTLEPADSASAKGSISLTVTFDNSKGDVDVVEPYLGTIDQETGEIDWDYDTSEEDVFIKGTDFSNTSTETVTLTKTNLEPGLYYILVDFCTAGSESNHLLDYYCIYNINVYGGFDTSVSETFKLNPVYTITYKYEDGTVIDAAALDYQTKYTRKTDFDLEGLEKEGYNFLGWFDADDLDGEGLGTFNDEGYLGTFVSGQRGDKTLVAKFEEISIPVTFHYEKDGSDEVEYETKNIDYYKSNNKAFLNEIASISSDEFVLSPDNTWYSDGITTGQIAALIEAKKNFDIYYDRIYSIDYTNEEGTGTTSTGDYVSNYTRNTPDFDLPVLKKDGYIFLGWYNKFDLDVSGATAIPKNGAEPITSISTGTRGDLELQAIWKNNTSSFTVTINHAVPTETLSINYEFDDDNSELAIMAADSEETEYKSYVWTIDGEETEYTTASITIDTSDWLAGEVYNVVVIATEKNESALVHRCNIRIEKNTNNP